MKQRSLEDGARGTELTLFFSKSRLGGTHTPFSASPSLPKQQLNLQPHLPASTPVEFVGGAREPQWEQRDRQTSLCVFMHSRPGEAEAEGNPLGSLLVFLHIQSQQSPAETGKNLGLYFECDLLGGAPHKGRHVLRGDGKLAVQGSHHHDSLLPFCLSLIEGNTLQSLDITPGSAQWIIKESGDRIHKYSPYCTTAMYYGSSPIFRFFLT